MEDTPVREHLSFVVGEERGIGSSSLDNIKLLSQHQVKDPEFDDLMDFIREEFSYKSP